VSTEVLRKEKQERSEQPTPSTAPAEAALRDLAHKQVKRVRRLKINAAMWVLGTVLLTTLWVANEWQANGAFKRFGNEGNPGDWSPTLWALGVGLWGLAIGIMALRVHVERPRTEAEVDREIERLRLLVVAKEAPVDADLRRFARGRLESAQRLKFHLAAWVLGMIVLTPLWALIEWQDNGGFERFSNDSQPGEWEPWILYVGGVWALVIAIFALRMRFDRPTAEAEVEREIRRLRSRG
jgi:hypothetical protein